MGTTLKKLSGRMVRQLMTQFDQELSHAKAEREHRVEQQDSKLRRLMAAIDHVNSSAALKKLQEEVKAIEKKEVKAMEKRLTHLRQTKEIEALKRNKWVRSAITALKRTQKTSKQVISLARRLDMHVHLDHALQMAQFKEELSRAKVEGEHRVEHQNFKLRKLKAAIDRIALLVKSSAAMKKMQKKEKAMEKQLSRLRQLEEIEVPERNKVVRSVMAILKKEQKQTSKQMISLGRRLGRHVHLDHAALRKEEKIVTSKEVTAVKQLHAALRKLMNTLLRRRMAQFKEELSRVKVKNEQRVEHQDFKLRKLKAAIDRIALHVNSNSAMK